MLQCHYIAKITENISVTVLSFCADYIKQDAHLCFGNKASTSAESYFILSICCFGSMKNVVHEHLIFGRL